MAMNRFDLNTPNEDLVVFANKLRVETGNIPSQSFFRVCCVLLVTVDDSSDVQIIDGHNFEQAYIGEIIYIYDYIVNFTFFKKLFLFLFLNRFDCYRRRNLR